MRAPRLQQVHMPAEEVPRRISNRLITSFVFRRKPLSTVGVLNPGRRFRRLADDVAYVVCYEIVRSKREIARAGRVDWNAGQRRRVARRFFLSTRVR